MSLTASQHSAVVARGNVLVMAGAGTGKTSTLVARCLQCLDGSAPASLDELLIVTFTDAAAAEARERIRAALDSRFIETGDEHWARQLALFDAAHIGTLHSFCFRLIRQHFYELGLDPQVAILDEAQARILAEEILMEVLNEHFAATTPEAAAVQDFIESYAGARDEPIRNLILQLHHYSQTRPDPQDWCAQQLALFKESTPSRWRDWLMKGIAEWRELWLAELETLRTTNPKAGECADILLTLGNSTSEAPAGTAPEPLPARSPGAVFEEILLARDGHWPHGQKTELKKPLSRFFEDAGFLATLLSAAVKGQRRSASAEAEPIEELAEPVLEADAASHDPLTEDWSWCRQPMLTLLQLVVQFTTRFAERKRAEGVVDFHDLEQLALQLLWDKRTPEPISISSNPRHPAPLKRSRKSGRSQKSDSLQLALALFADSEAAQCQAVTVPSRIARHWREKLRFVFVDEYQDINAAQDRIITALSREGADANRFLVGDVKQSIYRFRLAEPGIFRTYARHWRGGDGQAINLKENFRSRADILEFANSVFSLLMHESVGGVEYDAGARLIPAACAEAVPTAGSESEVGTTIPTATEGNREQSPVAAVEILFRLTEKSGPVSEGQEALEDLQGIEKEARHVALRLCELKASGMRLRDGDTGEMRGVDWRDIAILLRSPAGKAEGYAKEFERAGVPLMLERGDFFESLEVADLLNLLRLLDNPLQDVPLLAVLRSPLVALKLDDLAHIRLASRGNFWTALVRFAEGCRPATQKVTAGAEIPAVETKVAQFLGRYSRWRELARHTALSKCLEVILAETHYADWLRHQERGAQRSANVQRLLDMAEQYDQFQRQGLLRFLRFVEAQRAAGIEPALPTAMTGNAVRLMSIHRSKGLEFPVVVVADLGKPFNLRDLQAEIILDEEYGLCPLVRPPDRATRYPSAAHWLARQRQQRELLGEELRLLYVAFTRARENLIVVGTLPRKKWEALAARTRLTPLGLLGASCAAEWLATWLASRRELEAAQVEFRELDDKALSGVFKEPDEVVAMPAPHLSEAEAEELRTILTWEYPHSVATRQTAKTSVTALRREVAEELQAEHAFRFEAQWRPRREASGLSAAEIGNAHHLFLQHVALSEVDEESRLHAEAERLGQQRVLTPNQVAALDYTALKSFWCSRVGVSIRGNAEHVKRELEFTARFSLSELSRMLPTNAQTGTEGEFVVIQGIADLVVLLPREIWLLDFKTDSITESESKARASVYTPQLRLYALALQRIYGWPVTQCWLHFLASAETVSLMPQLQDPLILAPAQGC